MLRRFTRRQLIGKLAAILGYCWAGRPTPSRAETAVGSAGAAARSGPAFPFSHEMLLPIGGITTITYDPAQW